MDDFFEKSYRFELCLRIIDYFSKFYKDTTAVGLYNLFSLDDLNAIYKTLQELERFIG